MKLTVDERKSNVIESNDDYSSVMIPHETGGIVKRNLNVRND